MIDFWIKALEFGVLGLCAITLVLVWRVIDIEQKRDGYPRKGILQASYFFMVFSFALALLNGYVQLKEGPTNSTSIDQVQFLENELRLAEDKLLQIRSAAQPILYARGNILQGLPPGPERDTLINLVNALQDTLEQ